MPWGAVTTLAVFILGHIIASVWWASKINTTLIYIAKEIAAGLQLLRDEDARLHERLTRVEAKIETATAKCEEKATTIWRRIDELRTQQAA